MRHGTPLVDARTPSPLLAADAAAAYLHVNTRTLANWRYLGRGPRYIRIGRRPLYRQSELDAWMDVRSFPHTAAERAHPEEAVEHRSGSGLELQKARAK